MKIGFFLTALIILLTINSYVVIRGWQALPAGTLLRPAFLTAMIAMFICMFAGMILAPSMPHFLGKVISHTGYTYMLLFVYLFISFLLVDCLRIANYFFHFAPPGMQVIRLWAFAGSLLVIAVAMIWGAWKFNHPEIVRLTLKADTPPQHKTLRIVAASDIHLGVTIDKAYLKKYVQMINNEHPDIVLLAGDVSDRSMIPVERQHMDEELRMIKAPKGVFAINGNHEHFAERPDATANYLKKAGITVLRDETALVDSSFYLIGRDDRVNPNRKQLNELVRDLNPALPRILLDHQPYDLHQAEENGIDLQLSGHTHEGQFFPGNLIVKKLYELGHGYKKKGKTHIYVSSGLGIWGPQFRIGTQSELVVIDFEY